ncbi:MAG TPA: DUF2520 domain-containing protein [Acidimicrobiales bacterium]|jgi:predicted short-subunit dehydrogenase-like oxidoreductase (DUF2520 family)
MPPAVRIVGHGRAGGSLAGALRSIGWTVDVVDHGRAPRAARDVDLLILAVPDDAVASVAASVLPVDTAVVAHMAGSLGLDVLEPHPRRASLHPLVALPNVELGARRLSGAWFAVAGEPVVNDVIDALGGHAFVVDDEHRAVYHAAAVIASNHLVALLAQVERVAAAADVPLEAYLDLVRATVDNVAALGPADALTGPAARGDEATIQRHLAALPVEERELYEVLADACRRLAACKS